MFATEPPCGRISRSRTTTGAPPAWWTSRSTPLAFHHAFPRSYAGLLRAGEAAGRSPCPCVLQVDADTMVWLRSLHDSMRASYMYDRTRVPPTYVSGATISIPPVKPCRRRRHFSPRMRVNRFVFLNLPALSLGDHLGVTTSPQSPLPAGYVTLPVDGRSPPLGLMPPHSRGQGIRSYPPFS
jgi:hypothetical protein